ENSASSSTASTARPIRAGPSPSPVGAAGAPSTRRLVVGVRGSPAPTPAACESWTAVSERGSQAISPYPVNSGSVSPTARQSRRTSFQEGQVRVLEGRQPIRHRPRRRAVTRRRRLLVERLMGPLVIELLAEDVEAALLRRETARGRPGRLRFQLAMHPFMPAVLIRAPGLDELRQDPEADPPRRELRQARQRGGGERHAVVAANPPRQPILVEQPREDGLGLVASGRRQGLATQEVATKR